MHGTGGFAAVSPTNGRKSEPVGLTISIILLQTSASTAPRPFSYDSHGPLTYIPPIWQFPRLTRSFHERLSTLNHLSLSTLVNVCFSFSLSALVNVCLSFSLSTRVNVCLFVSLSLCRKIKKSFCFAGLQRRRYRVRAVRPRASGFAGRG